MIHRSASAILHRLAGSPVAIADPISGECRICGRETDRGTPYGRFEGANFTDQNKLRHPGGAVVCEPCVWAHAWNPPPGMIQPEGTKKGKCLRMYSHLWDDGEDWWEPPHGYRYGNKADKAMMREWLCSPRRGAWFAAIADSGQKHLLSRSRQSNTGK